MRLRSKLFIVSTGLLAGCATEGPMTTSSDITSVRQVEIPVTARLYSAYADASEADSSWNEACVRWQETLETLAAPNVVRDANCGSPSAISSGSSFTQLTSTATATVVASMPKDQQPVEHQATVITSPLSPDASAIPAWAETCEASLLRAKEAYGDQMLAGTCGTPSQHSSGGSKSSYTSVPTLWLAPARGTTFVVTGIAAATGTNGPDAQMLWRTSCDGWFARTAAAIDPRHLGGFTCGGTQNSESGSKISLRSETVLPVTVQLIDDAEPTVETFKQLGEPSVYDDAALASAIGACEDALAIRKEELGDRFLAASCARPWLPSVGGSTRQYEVTGTVWSGDLLPAAESDTPDEGDEPVQPSEVDQSEGDESPAQPDPALSQSATDCTNRCLAMMDACGAGPREQTCDLVCTAEPNEGELQCAEQTACSDFQDWFLVCGLGA